MHTIHNTVIDCSAISAMECSEAILVALEHGTGFLLKTNTPTDIVHGSVSIVHTDPPEPHIITVDVYETDEAPTATMVHGELVGRKSTLKRPDPMPTEQAIKDRIDTLV